MENLYSKELLGSFSELTSKLQRESKHLKEISNFMINFHQFESKALKKMQKLIFPLKSLINEDEDNSSIIFMNSCVFFIEKQSKLMIQFNKIIEMHLLSELKDFTNLYEKQIKTNITEGSKHLQKYKEIETEVIKAKNNYDNERFIFAQKNIDQTIQVISPEKEKEIKLKIQQLKDAYANKIFELNSHCKKATTRYKIILDSFQQLEEKRINIIKKKFTMLLKEYLNIHSESTTDLNALLINAEVMSARNEIQMTINDLANPSNPFQELDIPENTLHLNENQHNLEEEFLETKDKEDFISLFLHQIWQGGENTLEEKERMTQLFSSESGRRIFSEKLNSIEVPKKLLYKKNIYEISEVVNFFLTHISLFGDNNIWLLPPILNIADKIYYIENNEEIYMKDIINANNIWQIEDKWIELIDKILSVKLSDFESSRNPTKDSNQFLDIFKKIPNIFSKPKSDQKADLNAIRGRFYFSELCSMIHLMQEYKVNSYKMKKIILYFSKIYNLTGDNIETMLCDISYHNLIKNYEGSGKDELTYEMLKYKKKKIILRMDLIPLIIQFIHFKNGLANCLRLNKKTYQMYKFKIISTIYKLENLPSKNLLLMWKSLLNIKENNLNYQNLKESAYQNITSHKDVWIEIESDISRTYSINNATIKRESITSILRSYALFNKEVSYCQGMNFIANFLIQQFNDEEEAFHVFVSLIKNQNMQEVFTRHTPLLRKLLFQFNKILYIYIPDLAIHFSKESVICTSFASSWFITIFTSYFHKFKSVPQFFLDVWTQFLLKGWKSMFKTGLFILEKNKEKLLKLHEDDIIKFLNDLHSTNFYLQKDLSLEYKQYMNVTKLNHNLLQEIEFEFDEIQKNSFEGISVELNHEKQIIVKLSRNQTKVKIIEI